MPITSQLSSQVGDRTEASNRKVAGMCLENPDLVDEIADGLKSDDPGILGDCAEVMIMVAQVDPDLVAPYAYLLPPLLNHQKTRVRWEAMHALALVVDIEPILIEKNLSRIDEIIQSDKSVIARDWAIQAVAGHEYSGTITKSSSAMVSGVISTCLLKLVLQHMITKTKYYLRGKVTYSYNGPLIGCPVNLSSP